MPPVTNYCSTCLQKCAPTIQPSCQNYPGPSFCPGGTITTNGTNTSGCPIYVCKPAGLYTGTLILNGLSYPLVVDATQQSLTINNPATGSTNTVALYGTNPYFNGTWFRNGQSIGVFVDLHQLLTTFYLPATPGLILTTVLTPQNNITWTGTLYLNGKSYPVALDRFTSTLTIIYNREILTVALTGGPTLVGTLFLNGQGIGVSVDQTTRVVTFTWPTTPGQIFTATLIKK